MSVIQTSLNLPLPSIDGQLWIGDTGNLPTVGTLTAGTGISITNEAGSITVANILRYLPTSSSSVSMTPNTMYITTAVAPTFVLPSVTGVGDLYIVTCYSPCTQFIIVRNASPQTIQYINGPGSGSVLTTTVTGASITLRCVINPGTSQQTFVVESTNGAAFTLT